MISLWTSERLTYPLIKTDEMARTLCGKTLIATGLAFLAITLKTPEMRQCDSRRPLDV